MMTVDASRYWTYADPFDAPDDGKRYEIIDGKTYRLETPWTAHALATSQLLGALGPLMEHDRVTKRDPYARAGVLEYWLVSPEAALIEILVLDRDHYRTHARVGGDELIPATVLPELNCLASVVFR